MIASFYDETNANILKDVCIQRASLRDGDIIVMKFNTASNTFDISDLENMVSSIQKNFPNNQIFVSFDDFYLDKIIYKEQIFFYSLFL